jgi:hypothetical protein
LTVVQIPIHSCPWLAINCSPLAALLTPRHPTDQETYLHRRHQQHQLSRLKHLRRMNYCTVQYIQVKYNTYQHMDYILCKHSFNDIGGFFETVYLFPMKCVASQTCIICIIKMFPWCFMYETVKLQKIYAKHKVGWFQTVC